MKDIENYTLMNEKNYEVHECDSVTELRNRNQFCYYIVKGMIDVIKENHKNYDVYFLDRTYRYLFEQGDDWKNWKSGLDCYGWRIKIPNSQLANIIRDIWTNPNSQYEERQNLFIDNKLFERVFMYDYGNYIEILIG